MFIHHLPQLLGLFVLLGGTAAAAAVPQVPPATSQDIDKALTSVRGYKANSVMGKTDDGEFLRRVMKGLVGKEPTAGEHSAFSDDKDASKRAKKIEALLASRDFAKHWAGRFREAFFGTPSQMRRSYRLIRYMGGYKKPKDRFTTWLEEEIHQDRGWDKIVTAIITANGRTDQNPVLGYQVSFFERGTFEVEFAKGLSRHFFGIRLRCAECHDHPFDQWRVEDVYGLAAFAKHVDATPQGPARDELLVQWKPGRGELKITKSPDANDKTSKVRLAQGGIAPPKFLFGGMAGKKDVRLVLLAKFMTMKANTQLPRALVNRVWGWLMDRGIVEPADDFNMRNRALSKTALELLTRDAMENGYSLKRIVRVIANTDAYQRKAYQELPDRAEVRLRGAVYVVPRLPKPREKSILGITFKMPPTWSPDPTPHSVAHRQFPEPSPAIRRYRVPNKEGEGPGARLIVLKGTPQKAKIYDRRATDSLYRAKSEKLGEKWPVVTEIRGQYPCHPSVEGFLDIRSLSGTVLVGETWYYFRLAGPPETVEKWKADFTTLLGSVRAKGE